MLDRTIDTGTDVAGFAIFHPDDLAHRAGDDIAWYAEPGPWQQESAAGTLVCFGTGSDGGFRLRLTDAAPTRAELDRVLACEAFRLVVRHGRVLLDNTDALPCEDQVGVPGPDDEHWIVLPDGAYRVTVHALGPSPSGDPDELADYVVAFEAVPSLDAIAVLADHPQLVCWAQD